MPGVVVGIILLGIGGFFIGKKRKKIGWPCLVVGAVVFGVSLVVAGII